MNTQDDSTNGQGHAAVLGAGNMGTALAHTLACSGRKVLVWDHFGEVLDDIQQHQENRRFLPGVKLHPHVQAVRSPVDSVKGAGLVIVCVPSAFMRQILEPVIGSLHSSAVILNVAKGFAPGRDVPLVHSLQEMTPEHAWAHLAGPCIANEFARGRCTYALVASANEKAGTRIMGWLNGSALRVRWTQDIQGAALGGILKNVYAILLGALSHLDPSSQNLSAAVLSSSLHEMGRFASTMGASVETIYGLAGLGDLIATSLSPDSHNRRFGMALGSGKSAEEIRAASGWLPEGAEAVGKICRLAERHGLFLPLAEWVEQSLTTPPSLEGLLKAVHSAQG